MKNNLSQITCRSDPEPPRPSIANDRCPVSHGQPRSANRRCMMAEMTSYQVVPWECSRTLSNIRCSILRRGLKIGTQKNPVLLSLFRCKVSLLHFNCILYSLRLNERTISPRRGTLPQKVPRAPRRSRHWLIRGGPVTYSSEIKVQVRKYSPAKTRRGGNPARRAEFKPLRTFIHSQHSPNIVPLGTTLLQAVQVCNCFWLYL